MQTGLHLMGVIFCLFGGLLLLDAFDVFRFDHPITDWHLSWGKEAAWAIRVGIIALGLVLIFLTPQGDEQK